MKNVNDPTSPSYSNGTLKHSIVWVWANLSTLSITRSAIAVSSILTQRTPTELKQHVTRLCDEFLTLSKEERTLNGNNGNITQTQEFQSDEKTYRVTIEELGNTELLSRIIQDWIDHPESPKIPLPPKFKDRERGTDGKKLNEREFLEKYYGEFLSAEALYRDELRKLDSALVNHLGRYFTEEEFKELVPKKSTRIDHTLNQLKLEWLTRSKLNNLVQAAYRR